MRIALIAPPFIPVPPRDYGGTELFIARLAEGLEKLGVDVVVYANGESTINVEVRWRFRESEWPIKGEIYTNLKDMEHTSWAVCDARTDCDLIHINNAPGVTLRRFAPQPFVYTVHHEHVQSLTDFYLQYPDVQYVTISRFQQARETMPLMRTIHHGIEMQQYRFVAQKQEYLSFLGRIAPMKGTHLAIEVAKRTGIPLKIAGEVQPMHREYFDTHVKPHVDGKFIEYIGPADLEAKNELLGNSMALLFPIQWDEPFGLVMIEAMATGTPVMALPGGSVNEVVQDGVSGAVCKTLAEMVARVPEVRRIKPARVRAFAEENFSVERMAREYCELYSEMLEQPTVSYNDPEEPRAVA